MTFCLAACAEMLLQDKLIAWRAARLHKMGFGVGLWNLIRWCRARLPRIREIQVAGISQQVQAGC